MSMDIFSQGKALLQHIFYPEIRRTPTFTYLKSVFSEKYYNLLEPHVGPGQLDWYSIYKILDEEARNHVEVSFYVRHDLYAVYKPYLLQKHYQPEWEDIYVRKPVVLNSPMPTGDFHEVDKDSLEQYIKLATDCFPDYPNNKEYCQLCLAISQQLEKSDDKKNYNVLLYKNGEAVCFGSLLLSRKQKLGFIHNIGTAASARRQGLFSTLVHYFEHLAAENGVELVYANVENHGNSYHGFLKLGFQVNCHYHLFSL